MPCDSQICLCLYDTGRPAMWASATSTGIVSLVHSSVLHIVTWRTSEPHSHLPGNLEKTDLPQPSMALEVTQTPAPYPARTEEAEPCHCRRDSTKESLVGWCCGGAGTDVPNGLLVLPVASQTSHSPQTENITVAHLCHWMCSF